jgi:hypothetical protein
MTTRVSASAGLPATEHDSASATETILITFIAISPRSGR